MGRAAFGLLKQRKVVIIGAGGHAKVIIDILQSNPRLELIGCTDRRAGEVVADLKVLGDDSILPDLYGEGVHSAFVAIGDNSLRSELANRAAHLGFQLVNAISPFAYIAKSVKLGSGIAIMPGSVINADARINDNAIINTGATIDHECVIGKSCHVAPGCNLSGNVIVGEGAFLGTGTKVIHNVNIGSWSILGAGAVVIKDIPEHCLAVGIPARIINK